MSPTFEAVTVASKAQIAVIEALNPSSPFNTLAYSEACLQLGMMICVLTLKVDSQIAGGCLGLLHKGRLSSSLEIPSAPKLSHPAVFWEGVRHFCRKQRVWDLNIETYGSEVAELPGWTPAINRRKRCEWVIDLQPDDPTEQFSRDTRRIIKRAREAGLVVQRTRHPRAINAHLNLILDSLARRQARGEEVESPDSPRFYEVLLGARAGELFQVLDGAEVVSSIMVVHSPHGAYDQTSGTSPEGMRKGASRLLIAEICRMLKEEGFQSFNLGGAGEDEPGLREFKINFGPRPVHLEAASFSTAPPIQRKFRTAVRTAKQRIQEFRGARGPKPIT